MNHPTGGRAEVLRTRDFVGWTVSDSRGDKLGTVDDLLIDREGRVRYLSVNQGLFKKRVLLPVQMMSWGDGALVLSDWTSDQLRGLPPYDADVPLTAEVLDEMARAFPRFYSPQGASTPPATRLDAQIVPLREAKGFRLSGGSPDLTGWNVFGADGERVGKVAGMLVDPVAMAVRYLAVDVADDLFKLRDDRLVVVPTDRVDLRERGSDVWVQGLTAHDVARLPAYTGGALDPLVMQRVDEAFAGAPRTTGEAVAAGGNDARLFSGDPAARSEEARGEEEVRRAEDVSRDEELRREEARGDGLAAGEDGRAPSDAPAAPPIPAEALPPPRDQLADERSPDRS
jgi:sporulation protein YlmC with PRC-barrel domain